MKLIIYPILLCLICIYNPPISYAQNGYKYKTRRMLDLMNSKPLKFSEWQYTSYAKSNEKINSKLLPLVLFRYRSVSCSSCLDELVNILQSFEISSNRKMNWVIVTDAPTKRSFESFKTRYKKAQSILPVYHIPFIMDTLKVPYACLVDNDGTCKFYILPTLIDKNKIVPKMKNLIDLYFDQPGVKR